jgi:Peptidase family M23
MYSPVGSMRITSDFGPRSGRGGISKNHGGVDFGARTGTLIRAAVPGVVIGVGWNGGYGNLVKVRNSDGTIAYYAHMSRMAARPGMRVSRGTVIGYVGSTGNSTGPHLHFEIRKNGRPVNPMPWLDANYRQTRGGTAGSMSPGMFGGQRLDATQLRNARTILSVGRRMGASQRDLVISLMTAYQESRLRNLNYGHSDSLGLFQQRPSQGWGSPAQVTNPQYAARKFFTELFRVNNRGRMPLTAAAQAVQRSAFPNAYARWEALAKGILGGMNGEGLDMGPNSDGFEIEPEPVDQMIPRTASGGFPLDAVHLPQVSKRKARYSDMNMYAETDPTAVLDTSQIRDLRAQGPYNKSTNEPDIRKLLYGTIEEEPYNRSTHEGATHDLELRRLMYG